MTPTAFSKMIVLFCLLLVCNGQPVVEVPGENATTAAAATTTTTATASMTTMTPTSSTIDVEQIYALHNETRDQLTNDILRGTSTPVHFLDVPKHTETQLGTSVLLPCRTTNPVAECQWSWQPLPPVHLPLPDISESPNESTITTTSPISATSAPTAHPLPVRRFPAFGSSSNDCSVRFSSMKHEQTGYWTCAARNSTSDPFTATVPAKLTIVNDQGSLISFVKYEEAKEVVAGSSAQIMCRTKLPVRECQWSWRRLNESEPWNLEVKRFPAFGNDSTDCSIKFKNVLAEQEGYWSCGARIDPNSSFVRSSPVRFLISEVEFVQLSRGVQVAAGESVLLRCLVNKPVVRCEWSWRATNSSKEPLLVKKFAPNKDADHDCSVRFKNILYEEEGLWTCGIRLSPDGILHEAPPATVSLLPSAKVNLVEMPIDATVPIGTDVTLKCVTSSRVEKCIWSWKPLHGNDPEIVMREFPSNGDLGRDCSLDLPRVRMEQQGLWSCQVSIPSLNSMLSSSFVKLVTFEQEEVKFSELSQDIQISSGGTILLRCVTSSPVEQCRWSLTPVNSNTTVVVKQFPAAGSESRDCSVRLSHALAEQEGLWTCGAKIHGRENYTDAPPAKLSLLEPEPVVVTIWAAPHQIVTLACTLERVSAGAQCHWIHAPNIYIHQNVASTTKKARHNLQMNYSTGICTVEFKPDYSDLGQWTCKFTKREKDSDIELGGATLVLLNTVADEKLGWIVGALTAIVLFLMIIVVVLVVFKTRLFTRRSPEILETLPASNKDKSLQCTNDRRTKHDNCDSIDNANNILPNRSPHLYERVEKYGNVTPKMYENFGL